MPDIRMAPPLAIIPARAGSKGIPGKNLRRIAGKSILAWTIDAAKNSRHGLRVVVSTDGAEIAAEAKACGAEVVWRPESIAGDRAKSEDALLHVIDHFASNEGYHPALIVFLQCTSPLTAGADIDGTIDALTREGAETAVAVVPFHYFLWRREPHGGGTGINHDSRVRPLRQEREPQFLETGAVYVMQTEGFLRTRHRFFGKTALYEMPAERRWEIDDPVDLEVAEVLLRHQIAESIQLPAPPAAVVFDFDGVMTDDRVLVTEQGVEGVLCHRGDGLGLARLRETGIPMLILSKERNPVVTRRAEKLRLPVLQAIDDKAKALTDWATENRIDLGRTLYLGNDLNDLPCLRLVGWPVAVADAHPDVRRHARVVLTRPGGQGAVRELCERLLGPSLGLESKPVIPA
ncbi:MAG: acylneuraminate cytidylyltransferase [Verrucomicrobiales bacterium]|nr:acylneuraminate cytidylyltransferase [Verrucomicrobiales bacterium]